MALFLLWELFNFADGVWGEKRLFCRFVGFWGVEPLREMMSIPEVWHFGSFLFKSFVTCIFSKVQQHLDEKSWLNLRHILRQFRAQGSCNSWHSAGCCCANGSNAMNCHCGSGYFCIPQRWLVCPRPPLIMLDKKTIKPGITLFWNYNISGMINFHYL